MIHGNIQFEAKKSDEIIKQLLKTAKGV